jgi:hypothetical protein
MGCADGDLCSPIMKRSVARNGKRISIQHKNEWFADTQ